MLRSICALAVVVVVALASADVWLPMIGHWLAMPAATQIRHADAVVVHGGNPARTLYGMALYHRGLAPELWHTGYAANEVWLAKMVERGILPSSLRSTATSVEATVPAQAFHFLTTTSTWSDGTEIAATIRAHKLRSVIVVTDWWHSRRALCATRQQLRGYDVDIAFAPSPSPAGPENWWRSAEIRGNVVSELVKLGYYVVRYGMLPWGC
jgi:uncharacterized SAM-binding protein YcdF (DUF218 family)